MSKKELPSGWINKKRYYTYIFGNWIVLLIGFGLLILFNSIEPMGTGTVILWSVVIFFANILFKNSIVNKEKMEANKPMIELIRNIEGEEALKAVDELLNRDDLSMIMREKYLIEKVYTLLYLARYDEARDLLNQIERPKEGHNLYIYLEMCFELSLNPEQLLKEEFEKVETINDIQVKATIEGILEYRQAIIEAEKTGNPSDNLKDMIFNQTDIFTLLMNQYRIINIYRNTSRVIVRDACEKCLEYGNDLLRFTGLAKEVLDELGPVNEEELEERKRMNEDSAISIEMNEEVQEENNVVVSDDVIDAEVQETKEDNNQ